MRLSLTASLIAMVAATMSGGAMAAPSCGTDPVVLNSYFETGFPLPIDLSKEFSKQFPNVTFSIKEDLFANLMENSPRVLDSDNPPDLIRLPSISDLVRDGLLKNLDDYATAFGWDKYPPAELAQNRVAAGGSPRGEGSLYAMGLNYSMTGVFYNKALAAKIGMTKPPETVAEFEDLMAKAKAAGIVPIVEWNKPVVGLTFPLQNLMGAFGDPQPVNDWIFQKPGATIDTPANLTASQHLEQWIKAGYFQDDVNSVDYATAMGRFIGSKGLFIFNGDWESGNLDKQMAGNVGFFLMPPATAGGKHAAMSAPLTYGIGAKAKHADCAAFFLNWVATNPEARKIDVAVGGSNPGGPVDLPLPAVAPGSVTEQTLAAGTTVAKDNGAMDFIANATGAIYAEAWTPELQKMVGGRQDAAGMLKAVQDEYAKELSR
ncbi:MAG: extracellular solute-binding protein [Devosia sp.]|nr:extracellular solute-binding protein [Devosia sp.]